MRGRVLTALVVCAACAAAVAAVGCAPPVQAPEGPRMPRHVVLYVQDTLRVDATGPGGSIHPTTPHLDDLCREAVRYTRCTSPSSWTRPSMASVLTGTPPEVHGAARRNQRLSSATPTLAALLGAGGWRSLAVVTNPNCWNIWEFDRGFDRWRERNPFAPEGSAEQVNADHGDLLDELRGAHGDAPVFEWLHTMEPHFPYRPSRRSGVIFTPGLAPERVRALTEDDEAVKPDDTTDLAGLYRGEVADNDRALGRLIADLRERGVWDETLLIVTSDHGEEFGDHGGLFHGHTLYEELLHVPLVIRWPGGWGGGHTVDEPVSLLDIAPTVLRAAGMEPPTGMIGRDLAVPARRSVEAATRSHMDLPPPDTPRDDERVLFHELLLDEHVITAVRRGPWKYQLREEPDRRHALFHLGRDPGESRNLLAAEPDAVAGVLADLRAALERWRGSFSGGVHLLAVHGDRPDTPRRWRGTVRVEGGRIVSLRTHDLEPEDSAELDPGTGIVTVDLHTDADPNPIAGIGGVTRVIQDEDHLVLTVTPADATVTVDWTVSDGPLGPDAVWLGGADEPAGHGLPLAFRVDDPAVQRPAVREVPRWTRWARPGLHAWRVPPPRHETVEELDPETEARLRALGY